MMKKLFLTLLILSLPLIASAQMRVGVMNPETVLDALPRTVEIQEEMQTFVQQREQQYETQYQAWVNDVTAYQQLEQAGNLTDAELQEQQQQLVTRNEELQQMQEQINTQIENRWNELFAPLMDSVDIAVETVAEEMELDYIFNEVTSQQDPLVYYTSDRIFDITDRVIQTAINN